MILLLLLALLLPLLASCSDDDSYGAPCPIGGTPGPALSADLDHILIAHSLSETWMAIMPLVDPPVMLPAAGLTGQAPNDLEIVGDRMYVVNSLDNTVSVVDLITGTVLGCIPIGTSTNPWELEIDPSDPTRAWLTTYLSGELLELDLRGFKVLRRVTVEPTLEGLWVGDDEVAVTETAFDLSTFSYGTGHVMVFDKSTLAEIARLSVPTNPQFLIRGADDRVHVICTGDYGTTSTGRVARLETDWSAVRDTLDLGGAPARASRAQNGWIYLSTFCDGVLAYDSSDFTAVRDATNPLLPGVCAGDVEAFSSTLAVAEFDLDAVVLMRVTDGSILWEVAVGDGPSALAFFSHLTE